ncbi:MAG: hypothetical protein U5J63_01210 [Fodinibius sp.]|nr:hypothetical protein [Fodinibius sp.]
MKLRISLLTLVFGLFSYAAVAQNMQSDYEIQQSFKSQYDDYQDHIEQLSAPDSAKALIASIKEFDQKYSKHAELLNKALHPETYEQRIKKLKESSVRARNRLQTIEKQNTRLEKLETQLSSYEQNLQQLNQQTDSLKQAMQKSIRSEKQLSAMVREYRQSLEKRDELILAFIDSMVVAYQQIDVQSMQDLENIDKKGQLDTDGNALKMIHRLSVQNLNVLQNNPDKLRLDDYMRMADVQQQFKMMWDRLGSKITEVYDGQNATKLAEEVDQNLGNWKQMLQSQSLAAIKDTLAENNIGVSGFETPEELYSSLNSYLDQQIKMSKESSSEAGYAKLNDFQEFWNQVEVQWSANFADAGLITKPQMATINSKLDTWAEHAQPRSNNLLVYLLGGSVLLALALGVMLIREKKNHSRDQA